MSLEALGGKEKGGYTYGFAVSNVTSHYTTYSHTH
jgi:hypothetical protein